MRTAIHAHGCARLRNDPDLIKLTSIVYEGKMIQAKYFPLTLEHMHKEKEYLDLIQKANLAEERIISYVDTLVTAMNPMPMDNFNKIHTVPDPHLCCIDICLLDPNEYDEHYLKIVNCVQRHVCRVEGYCKGKKSKSNQCRFGFPFQKAEKTELKFTETKTKVSAEMNLARNDPFMNPHIRLVAEEWLCNSDCQIITDARAAQDYIAKYACKGIYI